MTKLVPKPKLLQQLKASDKKYIDIIMKILDKAQYGETCIKVLTSELKGLQSGLKEAGYNLRNINTCEIVHRRCDYNDTYDPEIIKYTIVRWDNDN